MEREIEMSREQVIYNALSIGDVSKGENPSATITGKGGNQMLNLVLPKGDKGDKGDATLIDITAGENIVLEKREDTIFINSILGSQDEIFQNNVNTAIEILNTEIGRKANVEDVVSITGYVATDNNYSNEEKQKVEQAGIDIQDLQTKNLKAYELTLPVSNWTQNTTTNLYEYNVTKEDITANHFVDIVFDSASKKMLSDVDVNSYDGGFILTTEELPEGELKGTVYYNLVSIGGGSVEG